MAYALPLAHAKGLGVIVKDALANGRLAGPRAEQAVLEITRDNSETPDAHPLVRGSPDSPGHETVQELAACLLATSGGLGAQAAVLVQVCVPLALIT